MDKTIPYKTRNGKGNDIIKDVVIKQYHTYCIDFCCPCCRTHSEIGVRVKDIVSSNFTDWAYVGDYVCARCADLFSLYFYSYVVDPDGIHIYNVRELGDQLSRPQKIPFLFVITTSQKKHLFYRARWNYSNNRFSVNLETETIYTTTDRMRNLFEFVGALLSLGCTKESLKRGEIRFDVLKKTGFMPLQRLKRELENSREIQIPLYCGKKIEGTQEELVCILNSQLTI